MAPSALANTVDARYIIRLSGASEDGLYRCGQVDDQLIASIIYLSHASHLLSAPAAAGDVPTLVHERLLLLLTIPAPARVIRAPTRQLRRPYVPSVNVYSY